MSEPKISVIVPIYKAEKYLVHCINSILAQTFTDFELLLIDDGSPDNSGKICDEYAKKDFRVKVFHVINRGVSSARNIGLDNAKGIWIFFIDSDDWIGEDYLNDLLSKSEDSQCVFSGYTEFISNGCYIENSIKLKDKIDIYTESFNQLDNLSLFNYCWGKLYRRDIIELKQLRFSLDYSYGEDKLFVLQYILQIDYVSISESISYIYRITANGLSKKMYHYNVIMQWKHEILNLFTFIDIRMKGNPLFRSDIMGKFNVFFILYSLDSLFREKTTIADKLHFIHIIYNKDKPLYSKIHNGIRRKIGYYLFKINMPLLSLVVYTFCYKLKIRLI